MAFFKTKKLGVADGKGRYDLPLNQGTGARFMILLVGLMTFLAMIALMATFILNDITAHWSSGLENRLTIEIPAVDKDGNIRKNDDIKALSQDVKNALIADTNIKTIEIMQQDEIQELVSPWLGDDIVLEDMPLPGLISLHLKQRDEEKLQAIKSAVKNVASDITVDAHESWLSDILSLAGSLKISAALVTLIIGFTTVTAIAGAIRSRMAEHQADIELLHLMGASDLYITKQLQRHAVILTVKGAFYGVAGGFLVLGLLYLIGQSQSEGLLPQTSFSGLQTLTLVALPVILGAIAAQTARVTVLRVLGEMP